MRESRVSMRTDILFDGLPETFVCADAFAPAANRDHVWESYLVLVTMQAQMLRDSQLF